MVSRRTPAAERACPAARGALARAWRLVLVVALALGAGAASADVDIETVRAVASGPDRDAAVVSALGEALRQVHGGRVEVTRETSSRLRRTVDGAGPSTALDRRTGTTARSSSGGLIDGYRVVSVERGANGVRATLDVDVPVYRAATVHSNRQRLAVYPVEVVPERVRVGREALAGRDAAERLTQSIVAAAVQSRRFSVLDRDMRRAIEREHRFVAGDGVPLGQKLALGRSLGADLLLAVRLRRLDLERVEGRNRLTGELSRTVRGGAVIEARVAMPSTGQLMWARTLELGPEALAADGSVQDAFASLSRELVNDVLDGIYPLRIVDGLGREAVVDRGGDLLRVGDRFDVHEIGRRYEDPYNGESLGVRERRVGTVEVVSVGSRTSRVRLVEGSALAGSGQVLRARPRLGAGRPAPGTAAARGIDGDGVRGTRRRVCLPMDPC